MAGLTQGNGKWVKRFVGETQEGAELQPDETVSGKGGPRTHLPVPPAIDSRVPQFDAFPVGEYADALPRSVPPLQQPCFPASSEPLA